MVIRELTYQLHKLEASESALVSADHHGKKSVLGIGGKNPDRSIPSAEYGLSTDRLTPLPFNLCSNAGSTHTSISQTKPLDMMLSTCTQLLWSTMAMPVLSGTCPVKPLYGLGHHAAAQFQGLGNLLIAYAIFMLSNNYFVQILIEFFAMRCHVELPVTSMREWEYQM